MADEKKSDWYYRRSPGDYLQDTLCLSMMEDGAYNRLLDSYYTQEKLPSDMDELYRIARAMTEEERAAVRKVVGKYFTVEGAFLKQNRVEREIAARRKYLEEQSRKGKLSAEEKRRRKQAAREAEEINRGSNPGSTVVDPRLEPEVQPDANLLSLSLTKDKHNPTDQDLFPPEACRLAGVLADQILANNPKNRELKPDRRERTVRRWSEDIERMIRLDGRDPPAIEAVIRWCQGDSFWRTNILSGATLREKYDRLILRMREKGHGGAHIDQRTGGEDSGSGQPESLRKKYEGIGKVVEA